MRAVSPLTTVAGFLTLCVGLGLVFGLGWALIVGGTLLFISGGIAESKAGR
jgi:hypothetical protein